VVGGHTWSLQLLDRNVQRFRGGLIFKAHRLVYHSTQGLRVIKKKKGTPGPSRTCNESKEEEEEEERILRKGTSLIIKKRKWVVGGHTLSKQSHINSERTGTISYSSYAT